MRHSRDITLGQKGKSRMAKLLNVCIDPGHGGQQPGAVSRNKKHKEKDIVLDISLYVASYLLYATRDPLSGDFVMNDFCPENHKPPVDVIMTRASDDTVTLPSRCNIANLNKATCFVSIHCNSYKGETANGIETWYFPTSSKSKKFASVVHKNIMEQVQNFTVTEKDGTKHPINNRGTKAKSTYYTLKHTTMPSLVVECGFMSHANEVELLSTDEYKKALARGIAQGILRMFAS